MKYKIAFISLVLVFLLSTCNLSIPSFDDRTVTIQSSPSFDISLGSRNGILDEYRDDLYTNIDDMLSEPGMEMLSRLEDENPDPDNPVPLTLELRQDMIDISVDDFAGENMALNDINRVIDPVEFSVPNINSTQAISEDIEPIPVPTMNFGTLPSFSSIPENSPSVPIPPISVNVTGYSSIDFNAGAIEFTITLNNDSPGMAMTVTAAQIQAGGTTIPASNTNLVITDSGTLLFPLAGQTLTNSLSITITAQSTGDGSTFGFTTGIDFSADTTISGGSGLDIDRVESGTTPVSMGDNPMLVSATIGTGDIVLTLAQTAIVGSNPTITLNLNQGGTTLRTASGTSPVTMSLDGLTIGAQDLEVAYSVALNETNATLTLDPAGPEVTGSAEVTVTNFSTMVVESADLNLEQQILNPIGSEITDLVTTIGFAVNSPRVEISLVNNLPNPISLTLDSTALMPTPKTVNYAVGADKTEVVLLDDASASAVKTVDLTTLPTNASSEPLIDFDITVTLAGFDSATNRLTLTNVTPDQNYSLSGQVNAILEMDHVVLKTVNRDGSFPDAAAGEDPLDFSTMLEVLPDTFNIYDIPANLVVDMGALEGTAGSIRLGLWVDYTDSSGVFRDDVALFGSPGAGNGQLLSTGSDNPVESIELLMNDRASNVRFYYRIEASGTTINIGGTTDPQRIASSLVAEIPVQFTVDPANDPADPDETRTELLDETGASYLPTMDEDILGRDPLEDNSDMEEFLGMVTSAVINVNLTNDVLILIDPDTNQIVDGDVLQLEITEDLSGFSETISLGNSDASITLNSQEMEMIINQVPFIPVMKLYIPTTEYGTDPVTSDPLHYPITLRSQGTLDLGITMHLSTDINYTLGGE